MENRMQVAMRQLPALLKSAIIRCGYNKRTIELQSAVVYDRSASSGRGTRGCTIEFDKSSGTVLWEGLGSWGGSNAFQSRVVDRDREGEETFTNKHGVKETRPCRAVTDYIVILKGTVANNKFHWGYLTVSPETFKEFTEGMKHIHLSEKERKALDAMNASAVYYKRQSFEREGLGEYSQKNPLIISMKERGLVKFHGPGIRITPEGKLAVNDLPLKGEA
jgi:hypothetical protein